MLKMRLWMRCLSGALLSGAMAGCGGGETPPEIRETNYGAVRGTNDSAASGTYSWKGIPFAQAPVGPLRWRAPVEPTAWSGVRDAGRFGSACLQMGRIYGPGANNQFDNSIGETLNTPLGSEDCLTLNIWRPASSDKSLPVVMFVHGGSAISGYTADPVYDGGALALAANAVVVTANYRLDVLGYMQMPALGGDTGSYTGNFALLDNMQALKFLQANVANFGGDPGNVTLMGQSAGAINALALLAAPQAKGLFQKIIPISGGISLAENLPKGTIPTLNPKAKYAAQSSLLLGHLMVDDGLATDLAAAQALAETWSPAQTSQYMRAKDGRVLLKTVLQHGLGGSGPIPDGVLLPANPMAEIEAGRYPHVPVLVGNTGEEGKLFAPFLVLLGGKPGMTIGDAERFRMMQAFDPDAPPTLTSGDILDSSYLPVTAPVAGYNAKTDLLSKLFMGASRDNLLQTLRSQQENVWAYQFDWRQEPAPWNDVYGSAHAFDLPFIFGNFGPSVFSRAVNSRANATGRLGLSAAMMGSVGAFVHTGNPNHAGLGRTWEPWPRLWIFDAGPADLRLDLR